MSFPKKSSGRFATTTVIHLVVVLTVVLAGTLCQAANGASRRADLITCGNGESLPSGGDGSKDVQVTGGACFAHTGTYHYHNFNIYMGGTLQFVDDGDTDLWAANILVENNGSLLAGTPAAPYGNKGTLTIHLWGKDQGLNGNGIACQYPTDDNTADCGVPKNIWGSNLMDMGKMYPSSCTKSGLPGGVNDCFYEYMPIKFDGGDPKGYFGYKVLAVSYGGTLQLFGQKGASYAALGAASSGTSWARLAANAGPGEQNGQTLILDRAVDWVAGDKIVVTTTDYLPGHSEELVIKSVSTSGGVTTITLTTGLLYLHNGTTYDLGNKNIPKDTGPDPDPNNHIKCSGAQTQCVETRAAVGLLTRSIRIVSGGDADNTPLPDPGPACPNFDPKQPDSCIYFGGHTIFRQGFQAVQIQGVEFYQMGQGGRIMHYPVHFHMARQTPQPLASGDPPVTFVKDSSVWDSMTRWYTIHATQGVTLARNVGYLSIGNGYYLEDGSETDNLLYSNLGVFARAGIDNKQNPRKVPGILGVDVGNPTLFWMMNGWNDFEYNMASGAGTCGTCYWFVPANVSGDSQYERWFSYASEQQGGDAGRAGTTPLRKFVGNSCTSAEYSFNTIGAAAPCVGLNEDLKPIPITLPHDNPRVLEGSSRQATQCPSSSDDCSKVPACSYSPDGLTEPSCMITDIDHYTTSFHWADLALGSLWLRKQWYLFTNSAVTDVQQGGLTFVSGGGYTGADEVPGYWALAHKDVFIGNTQTGNPFASNAGPFNPGGLTCDAPLQQGYCANLNEGISIPLNNFGAGQRLFSIYDGPAYEEGNAYLDITSTNLTGCKQDLSGDGCKLWAAAGQGQAGVLWDPKSQQCYLPNAAIAWKQPNGFYYPPAFHSSGLYFNNVDIRHFVIEPLFELPVGDEGFKTDVPRSKARYCGNVGDEDYGIFQNFTDIDRQTELSDDDGSLTGLRGPVDSPSISVNKDAFFGVPLETAECASDIPELMPQGTNCPFSQYPDLCATANTSPYDYVTTVVFPEDTTHGYWSPDCTGSGHTCSGVPLYREDLNPSETKPTPIRMMGQNTSQRSNLTVNHGRYYIDTTVSLARQNKWKNGQVSYSVFQANKTYNVFLLFGKPSTSQTYDLFVGKSFDPKTMLKKIRVDQEPNTPVFTDAGPYDCDANPTECSFDPSTGYLTVTLDLAGSKDAYDAASQYACRPETFCSWDATKNPSCFCNPAQQGASKVECDNACNKWATKDVRCPKSAQGVSECYGFAFTLPGDFPMELAESMPPPYVQCFNKELNWQKNWNVSFEKPATQDNGTVSCDYGDKLPQAQFCPGNPGKKLLGTGVGSTDSGNQP